VSSSKRRAATGVCTYCGASGRVTADHIPPKGLFPRPRPGNLVTVPACARCNAGASRDDEYFRHAVLASDVVQRHPEAAKLLATEQYALGRSQKRRTLLGLARRVRKADLLSAAGIYVGTRPLFEVDTPRICRVASRIVHGFYFYTQGEVLPPEYLATAVHIPQYLRDEDARRRVEHDRRLGQEAAQLELGPATTIGDGVFSYRIRRADKDQQYESRWLLEFYGFVRFVVITAHSSKTPASTHKHTFPACLGSN
jgi:hypothetical protein